MKPLITSASLATILVLASVFPASAGEATVSVVVGNLAPSEGGPADAISPLGSPFGIDFNSNGDMLIVELEGGRVHRLSAAGQLATIAGDGSKSYLGDGGPAAEATFNGMHNVAVTPAGDIYIADSWNHCIRKIDSDTGIISTIAGTGEAGFRGDGGPAVEAAFDFIMCISLNATNDALYVADLKNRRIRAVNLTTGIVQTVAGNGEKGVPLDGADAKKSPLVDPRAVAVDSNGVVYILERNGNALRTVDRDGKIRTVAGDGKKGYRDGPAKEAQFASPKHICVDDDGNVLIADDANRAIRKYNAATQTVSTVLGRGRGKPAVELDRPHGVCFERGRLYVVDSGNNRILRVDPIEAEAWPRFRGPNGGGVSSTVGLPDDIDLQSDVLWKVGSGQGCSSPILVGGRLMFTSFDGDSRSVECLDAKTGKPLWNRTVQKVRDEVASHPNSPATCTPTTDGQSVVAFFPDAGLFCYSVEGVEQWRVDVGPFHSMHGIAGSPILAGNLVVLATDQLQGSRISAFELATGKLAWTVARIDGLTGAYTTPSLFTPDDGPSQIVLSGPQELCGYLATTGEKIWSVPGVTNAPISLPLVCGARVFTCEPLGSATPISMIASLDKDKDGKFSLEEAKASLPMFRLLERIDIDHGNGDQVVEASEWDKAFGGFLNRGGLVAVDLTDSASPQVRWNYRKSVPSVASPLVVDDVLYVVQDGGIVTTIDPDSGQVHRRGRLSRGGKKFYASPVAADGKLFLVDTQGQLSILKAAPNWEELSTTDLGEPCFATPAICGGRIYVRTSKTLYCFGVTDLTMNAGPRTGLRDSDI